ncbi:MAG: hypothetical protein DRN15_02515 [Thermoprotei archaeon]|nr:MAG: hypothetical protein DRM97_04870 [Thermoprotei archaeon]RLF24546.1 MAG: hypothetical protein DRN15_02515 [Thermoprotei archaeon]
MDEVYMKLYSIWRKEVETAELQSVPENLYEVVRKKLKELKEVMNKEEVSTIEREIARREYEVLRELAESLFRLRMEKALVRLIRGEVVNARLLCVEERELYNLVKNTFEEFLSSLVSETALRKAKEKEEESKYVIVRFIMNCGSFIGVDENVYGPFDEEDVALIPRENAEALISKGVAVKIHGEG